jgi:hypothetical protein
MEIIAIAGFIYPAVLLLSSPAPVLKTNAIAAAHIYASIQNIIGPFRIGPSPCLKT